MKDFKLCYIDKHNTAYFTTQDLDKQTGDDWNDAPYEHNAGEPYLPFYRYYADGRTEKHEPDWNEDGTPKWEIYKVAYECIGAETPAEIAGSNSRYSVDDINAKLIPWLSVFRWSPPPDWQSRSVDRALFAGASVEEFTEFVESCGGTVYFPKEKNNEMS